MSRIIFIPQYPTPMRYQEWWINAIPKQFTKFGFDVYTLGDEKLKVKRGNTEMFSPINAAIEFECSQIDEYMNLELRDDDILFVADISFPGFFMNVLYHKRPSKVFSFCHATSINNFDYFGSVKNYKYPVETSHAALCNKVFVGSEYHQNKLQWANTEVTYLPNSPYKTFTEKKVYDIISVARPTKQKVNYKIEEEIKQEFGKVTRKETNNWEDYYKFLSSGKILLISSQEDTFNYTIIEAINNNTIVLAPNKLCFPEILNSDYLYNNLDDLKIKLYKYLANKNYILPIIKCKESIDNFFTTIVNFIKEEY